MGSGRKQLLCRMALVLVLGQLLSLALTGIGVFTILFNDHTGEEVSSTLTGGAYFIIVVIFAPYTAFNDGFVDKLRRHWWKFIILGFADVESSYLQTLAFKYTTVASNQAITNGSSTFWVMILALIMIKARYKLIHYVAMVISTCGMVIVIIEDFESDEEGKSQLVGDLLCVASGFLLAVDIVGEEFLVKGELGIIDFLTMLSLSGAFISGIQLCILDRTALVSINWDLKAVLYFMGYHIFNVLYYIFFAPFIMKTSSMVVSLSLLTSDVYSLLFGIFLFHNKFSGFYIGGFVVILLGLVLFNIIVAPEGGSGDSVFSTLYWRNYCHSLWCQWPCCRGDGPAGTSGNTATVNITPNESTHLLDV